MPATILCKICNKRRALRACPAVQGDICPICCGTEREVSLSCPLDCEYLQQAHRHEKPIALSEDQFANSDIEVSESFIREHEELLLYCVYSLLQAALRTPNAVDSDAIDALAAVIQTRRTLESGLFYQTRPENVIAAAVQTALAASLADYEKIEEEREGFPPSNKDILRILVFLHRIGQQSQNGRPRGRMYLDLLRQMAPDTSIDERAPGIII